VLILAVIAASVALLWGAIAARYTSLLAGCTIFVAVGYVFGAEFWHAQIGPLPLTLDRLMLIAIAGAFVIQWRKGTLTPRPLAGCDWLVVGLLAILSASALLAGAPEFASSEHSAWGRLVMAFVVPAFIYFVVRLSAISPRRWAGLLACFAALGVYLGLTAILEWQGVWSLVFPRYIADPNLGIHFGRARGPGLNAASLGMYLTACGCCAYALIAHVSRRSQQLALLLVLPLVAIGVFATYTRSTWLGLVASGLVIAWFQMPRRLRLPAIAACGLAGLLVAGGAWSNLIGLKREGTAAEAHHSVDQRASFAYVSWQMFRDNPIFGVGFGRFYDRKLPYLSDRSQQIELESIRHLHHHNTLLGLLTETGLIGLAAFLALLAAWAREAWRLANLGSDAARFRKAQGVLMLALVANYLCSALFHDLTLVPAQHWLLFLFAAVTVNLRQYAAGPYRSGATERDSCRGMGRTMRSRPRRPGYVASGVVELFGMQLSRVTMREAVAEVMEWASAPRGAVCRYVVTPNVDHAVLFQRRADLRAAYADASLVLADGAPIVLASRLLGARAAHKTLPERVAGSDLVPQLFAAADRPLRVFLLGAAPGVAEKAAARIERKWSPVKVVGCYAPPLGFETNEQESAKILEIVAAAAPDLLVVGLGAPKQELWVHQHHRQLQAKVALCVGATIDFLAGQKRRSPVWMRRAGLEWAHRVFSEPRRLAGRYARDAWAFPRLVWRELVKD
jgi:N-acetylglucosaminyldiphosphoundecaprenol N-acetyl-beta-D-mannosaminyltransferase